MTKPRSSFADTAARLQNYPFSGLIQRLAETQFWPYVEKQDACWLWRGPRMRNGYGAVYIKKHLDMAAHRFAYELLVGVIPEGLDLDHLCRVRSCVNPTHVEPVTHAENVKRGDSGRHRWCCAPGDVCPQGHELTGENGYIYIGKAGRRYIKCHQCDKARYEGACAQCGVFYKDLYTHNKRGRCPGAVSANL